MITGIASFDTGLGGKRTSILMRCSRKGVYWLCNVDDGAPALEVTEELRVSEDTASACACTDSIRLTEELCVSEDRQRWQK